MATSKELYAWVYTLRSWAASVDATEVRKHMIELADELEQLARREAAAERQFV